MFPKNRPWGEVGVALRCGRRNVPSVVSEPASEGSRSEAAVVVDTRNRIDLVAGRADYCGVVKKTIFTVGNYLLPLQGRLSMHCSANVGKNNDADILFVIGIASCRERVCQTC